MKEEGVSLTHPLFVQQNWGNSVSKYYLCNSYCYANSLFILN